MLDKGYHVKVIQIVDGEKITGDALYHKSLFLKCDGNVLCEREISTVRKIVELSDVVIDAMLGIGVQGNLRSRFLRLFRLSINQMSVYYELTCYRACLQMNV